MYAGNRLIQQTMVRTSPHRAYALNQEPPRPYPYMDAPCPRCKGKTYKEHDGHMFHEIKCFSCSRTLADWHSGKQVWRIRYDSEGNPVAG